MHNVYVTASTSILVKGTLAIAILIETKKLSVL